MNKAFPKDFVGLLGLFLALLFRDFEVCQWLTLLFYCQISSLFQKREAQAGKIIYTKNQRLIIRFLSLIFYILFAEHIFACIFFKISHLLHQLGYPSFYEVYGLINQNWLGQYINEVYFASTTMITVGFGDMTP